MKKIVFFVVMLFLLASFATVGLDASETKTNKELNSSINVLYRDATNAPILKSEGIKTNLNRENIPIANTPIANQPEDEIHPSITSGGGVYFAGYSYAPSIVEKNVYTVLSNDGINWNPYVFIEGEDISDYPAFDYWGGYRFCGTFSGTEPLQYLLDAQDVTDPEAPIDLIYWDWSDNGWSNFKEFDIACHNSQEEWEYGVMSTIATTDYTGYEVVDGPHMFFRSPDEEGTGYISWDVFPGCAHSAASIDKTQDFIYNVYDNFDETSWDILVWKRDFSEPLDGESEFMEIESEYYAQYPTIDANGGNIIVVAESDENFNKDLVCYYSTDSGANWQTSYVTNTAEDESAPDIVVEGGGKATVVFVKDGDLYSSSTDDYGATWTSAVKINDQTGTVVQEYRTADTCSGAVVWTDTRDGNKDIYFDTLGNAPNKPSLDGPTSGRARQSLTYTATSTDPNGDDIFYLFDWGDGSDSGWLGPYSSGEQVSENHRWTSQDDFEIKVKAKDTSDVEGPWSDPFPISIPKTRQIFINIIYKLLEKLNLNFLL